MNTSKKGKAGEDLAASILEDKGYTLIKRNFKCPAGEVDIIGKKDEELCFFEIKYWDSFSVDQLEYAIDRRKQLRIIRSSRHFIMKHKEYCGSKVRFDVLFLSRNGENIHHIEYAFTETGWS